MTLRPIATQWFELVTVQADLMRAVECLSRTGAVELEARSGTADRLLFPGLADALAAHRELAKRYHGHWPAPVLVARRHAEHLGETLDAARRRIAAWTESADPLIAAIERVSQEASDLEALRAALTSAGPDLPDLTLLGAAGPRLRARLLILPPGVPLRELPPEVLFEAWQTANATYTLVVGRTADIAAIEDRLSGLKGRTLPLPPWLPSRPADAAAAIGERLADLARQRARSAAKLAESCDRMQIAQALGDIALIEWIDEHASELRGSERLGWITGWTSDPTGSTLRGALDQEGVRYVLRLAPAPAGTTAPLMLRNPFWARGFELFARLLGTPGRNESDPSQIVAIMASSIFGFMFGDVGQGAVILAAGLLLARRMPLLWMLVPGGVMAILFGVLFGSVFCREDVIPAQWIRPLADPLAVLTAGVSMGVVIILIGLALDGVQMHWRGEAGRWWGHRIGLVVAYCGIVLAPLRAETLAIAAAGAAWYIVGAAVLAGRDRLAAALGAAGELVEQGARLLINTISFARIGAFALAHAGLSAAIIEIASASGRAGYWLVLAIGNVLVIALESLVVGIQTTRLLLFEFFIRFLTGAGREFKPLPPPAVAKTELNTELSEPTLRGTP